MLNSLRVRGFKSLRDAAIDFRPMTVLFGPNAAGKSNILDAIQALSRLTTERTVADALTAPIRGHAVEAFSFPEAGLPGLLDQDRASFHLDADITSETDRFRYEVTIDIQPETGALSVGEEVLAALTFKTGEAKGQPRIETAENHLLLRSRSRPGRPRQEPLHQNHTKVSDPRLGASEYKQIEAFRSHMAGWRTYYLDPRVAMRRATTPAQVTDIGVLGESIAPFLFYLKSEKPKHFESIRRTIKMIIPSIEDVAVDLDRKRGTLDILVRQAGIDYSSRIISEGTLRVLALCAITVNPWIGGLVAFEEPENGVHPRRIELIARLLSNLIDDKRQVVVTTHSPLFCKAVHDMARQDGTDVRILKVSAGPAGTTITPLDPSGPLFTNVEIQEALKAVGEDGKFESLMARGLLDA